MTLSAKNISVGYGQHTIINDLTVDIPEGSFTVIVGPNACGKSTLLGTLARIQPVMGGSVLLDGAPIESFKPKEIARRVSMLPQSPVAPEGITVYDLVARGRYPHQGLFRQWTAADEEAVDSAMRRAKVIELAERYVDSLSGGQRQRAWIALVLAQQTSTVLLDEPTTYLDLTHQVEVLNLARDMQRDGTTVVAVLHELTLAFRYATHLIMMKDGAIRVAGSVADCVTPEVIEEIYELPCTLLPDPHTKRPIVVPR